MLSVRSEIELRAITYFIDYSEKYPIAPSAARLCSARVSFVKSSSGCLPLVSKIQYPASHRPNDKDDDSVVRNVKKEPDRPAVQTLV
jgi:hypothetical protein